ncbi:MAG: WbqC family protein [Prevotellaceae bacterium]|jgi:hypothetical protein|nr:WbqC family protein [Prevotellaceae bacterium]
MERIALLASAYLAPVSYYAKLLAYGRARIEQFDHYVKQTYRNRCTIAAAAGRLDLTVPIVKPAGEKSLVRDIRISDHGRWRSLHWNALVAAYNHSPFFVYYADDLRPFYEQHIEFLVDFNEGLCRTLCGLLDLEPVMERTASYHAAAHEDEDDYRTLIQPKQPAGADTAFSAAPYYQVFEAQNGFLANLSIVDLLFNMGPESVLVLQRSVVAPSPAIPSI